MIQVASSVWFDNCRSADVDQGVLLDSLLGRGPIAVGALITADELEGFRNEGAYKLVRSVLEAFDHNF